MIEVGRLNPEHINAVWPDVSAMIEAKGSELLKTYSLKELYCAVLTGTYELWLVTRGGELKMFGFCVWDRHDERSDYHVLWIVGEGLENLKAAIPVVERYACLHGASELIFGGRGGWARVLEPLGFVPKKQWHKPVSICWRH